MSPTPGVAGTSAGREPQPTLAAPVPAPAALLNTPLAAERKRRTYRACVPCRSRKLKCDLGDPDHRTLETCRRCLRESRQCVKSASTTIRDPPARALASASGSTSQAAATQAPGPSSVVQPPASATSSSQTKRRRSRSPDHGRARARVAPASPRAGLNLGPDEPPSPEEEEDESESDPEEDPLVSTDLENPRDALKLLATASSLKFCDDRPSATSPLNASAGPRTSAGPSHAFWERFEPVQLGILSSRESEALFTFFETEMNHLYQVLGSKLFDCEYLAESLCKETLLLGAILAISSRYSVLLINGRDRQVHVGLSSWIRRQLQRLLDGDPALRVIGSVEALLLLSEWPLLPLESSPDADADFLAPSLRYDALCWSQIGMAVRLAQELGLQNSVTYTVDQGSPPQTWEQERVLRTWIFCYNADRHVSVRLGRNSVFQAYMSSQWWEKVSDLSSRKARELGHENSWVESSFAPSLLACLMGTIQDRLYATKDVTRVLLRTGVWESFLKSFKLELQFIRRSCRQKLGDGRIDSALLQIELDYASLYANAIALQALQRKLQRRIKAQDLYYRSPSLLNLIEGPYILEALHAARSIIQTTVHYLAKRDLLKCCPSRIFQRMLFAATFLYKALAVGVIEHGRKIVVDLLELAIRALWQASLDDDHFVRVFARLLQRLQDQWTSVTSPLRSRAPTALPSPGPHSNGAESSSSNPQQPAPPPAFGQASIFGRPPVPAALPHVVPQDGSTSTFDVPMPDFGSSSLLDLFTVPNFDWQIQETLDAGRAQDLLLQDLWTSRSFEPNDSFNLYQTLLGDDFVTNDPHFPA